MQTVGTYTKLDEIRAILGLDKEELPDDKVELNVYVSTLERELKAIHKDLVAGFVQIQDIKISERTPEQQELYNAITIYATYSVCKQLADVVSMYALKTISDGKATGTRFSNATDKIVENVKKNFYGIKSILTTLASAYYSTSTDTTGGVTNIVALGVASPASDPVTNT